MGNGIIVCGCNGSGKSTLGKELASRLNYKFLDIEDYYFPNKDADYIYESACTRNEVEAQLLKDMKMYNNFVLATVKGNFNKEIVSLIRNVVCISVDKEIRLRRVKERSFQKFGRRILLGGDLYEKENLFFEMVESRTEQSVEEWLDSLNCNVFRVDGTKPVKVNIGDIIDEIGD